MSRPTSEQIKFFRENELQLPPSKQVADTLIGYIKFGNSLYGSSEEATSEQRMTILREAQRKWIGRRVIRYSNNGDGTLQEIEVFVHHLSARTKAEIRTMLEKQGSLSVIGLAVRMPDRFKAVINTRGMFVGLEWLKDPYDEA